MIFLVNNPPTHTHTPAVTVAVTVAVAVAVNNRQPRILAQSRRG